MASLREYVSIVSMSLGIVGVLGIVFAYSQYIPAGEMSFQWLWCGIMLIVFCILASLSIFVSSKGMVYFHESVVWGLILIGCIEAILGLLQIYGFRSSNHSFYSVTGSFFNPGPYSGYLALVLPVCFYKYLQLHSIQYRTFIENISYYIVIVVLLLLLIVIPSGMSRTAWVSSAGSCLFVYGAHYNWLSYVNKMRKSHFNIMMRAVLLLFVFIALCGVGMYHLKPDSAIGRMFIWKISSMAIADKPLTGYGHGMFMKAYGESQENYFSTGLYSRAEERVAGCPEYAFNEYLRIAVEYGVPILLLFLVGICYCIYLGIKNRRIGICGALISLMIFSFASYPMEYPCFMVAFIFLVMSCITRYLRVVTLVFTIIVGLQLVMINKYDSYVSWENSRVIYKNGAIGVAKEEYEVLYKDLKNRPRFLYEYGCILYKEKEFTSSIKILKEANCLSCNTMIMNLMAKSYQELKEYKKAEKWLIKSTNMLPNRIYPYYLLAKLYVNPEFYDYDKFLDMAYIVLTKEPKVESPAIDDMKKEIKKMLEDENM